MITTDEILAKILRIAQTEFSDIVETFFYVNYKLIVVLKDKSFVDVGASYRIPGRFSFHWECKNEMIFRYDNFPDCEWENVDTYPFHFHNGSQNKVESSPFSTDIPDGFRDFMELVRKKLT